MPETEGRRASADPRRLNRLLVRAIWIVAIAVLAMTVFVVWRTVKAQETPRALSPAEQMIAETEARLKKTPNNVALHNQMGELLHYTGDLQGARESFRTALKYKKDYGPALRNLAMMDWADGEQDKALDSLETYLSRSPKDPESWFILGTFQQEKERWADAAASYEEALKLSPMDSAALYRWGVCLEELGKRDEAIAKYKESIKYVTDYEPATEALKRLGVTP